MNKEKKFIKSSNELLMGIIGDEETVTGFLLAGVGERTDSSKNFFIVTKEEKYQIEEMFASLINRSDIGIILICQHIADQIREVIEKHEDIVPTILEIPSKNIPYQIEKDSLMQKAMMQLYGSNRPTD
jgi:V-type H+-transporting ATPase subunit F